MYIQETHTKNLFLKHVASTLVGEICCVCVTIDLYNSDFFVQLFVINFSDIICIIKFGNLSTSPGRVPSHFLNEKRSFVLRLPNGKNEYLKKLRYAF